MAINPSTRALVESLLRDPAAELPDLFYFPFHVQDWLGSGGVAQMLPEQEGAYIRLLALSWMPKGAPPCTLPIDTQRLAQMSRLGSRWRKLGPLVLEQFTTVTVGGVQYYRNEKLWEVFIEALGKHLLAKAKGASGGHAKARNRGSDHPAGHPAEHPTEDRAGRPVAPLEPPPEAAASPSSASSPASSPASPEVGSQLAFSPVKPLADVYHLKAQTVSIDTGRSTTPAQGAPEAGGSPSGGSALAEDAAREPSRAELRLGLSVSPVAPPVAPPGVPAAAAPELPAAEPEGAARERTLVQRIGAYWEAHIGAFSYGEAGQRVKDLRRTYSPEKAGAQAATDEEIERRARIYVDAHKPGSGKTHFASISKFASTWTVWDQVAVPAATGPARAGRPSRVPVVSDALRARYTSGLAGGGAGGGGGAAGTARAARGSVAEDDDEGGGDGEA